MLIYKRDSSSLQKNKRERVSGGRTPQIKHIAREQYNETTTER